MVPKLRFCFLLAALLVLSKNSYAQVYKNVPAAIHIQSNISDGRHSFEQIIKSAKEKDIKVLVFTDSVLRRWEYGIRPLENIIKRTIEHNSVFRFGIRNYLNLINSLQEKYPDMVLVPGAEVTPFYYWEGAPLGKDLSLYNWHKQLIAVGLENEKDYRLLPIVASYSVMPLHRGNLIRLWPILFIILGIVAIKSSSARRLSKRSGYIILVVGTILLINNLRFNIVRFDAYHGDQKTKPYQELINYVNYKKGLVFWVHPEAENVSRVAGVNILTYSYKDDLLHTYNYSGSSMLFYDNRSIARTGEAWDEILLAYCRGRRKPIWTMATIDYYGDTQDISRVQTILLLPALNKKEALKALDKGRMYSKLNNQPNDFSLDKFVITDNKDEVFGFMGEDIKINSKPEIIIETSSSSSPEEPIEIKLIRNGKLIKTFNPQESNARIRYQDDYYYENEKIFYRIMIKSNRNLYQIVSNPIFVEFISE